jgi:glycosyltransferase involved in cell wall biosynthesis
MNTEPKVSVVIPTYNRAEVLKRVIQSVLAQTLPVHQIIVVDDGSVDGTEKMIENYKSADPKAASSICYIFQKNQGQSAGLNNGISHATGDWLAFGADDDLWLPWKLEWQFRALAKYQGECGFSFTDAWFMNNPHMKMTVFQHAGRELSGPVGLIETPVRMAVDRNPVWVQTVLAKTELVRRVGGFDPALRYSEDHDFVFRMSLQTKFCYVSIPMMLIDRSPAETRHLGAAKNWHNAEYCLQMNQYRFEKQLRLGTDLPVDVRKIILGNLRSIHSHWATFYLKNGDYAKARQAMSVAVRYDLTSKSALKWLFIMTAPRLAKIVFKAYDESGPPRYDRASWDTA